MIKGLPSNLRAAMASRTLVRIERCCEDGWVDGYVVALAKQWFVLHVVGEGITFVGYQAFRVKDVTSHVAPAPYAAFKEKALRMRKLRRTVPAKLDLSSTAALLLSANAKFPLVTVHCELVDPEVCHIGQVIEVSRTAVKLCEIDPDATWDSELTSHRLTKITRIDFGGPYEEALALVGGRANLAFKRVALKRVP